MTDIETLIRDANPVRAQDLPAGASPAARQVLALILPEAGRRRPARGLLSRLALAAAAGGTVAAVVAVTLHGSPETSFTPSPAVVAALRSLSVLAAAQPGARPPGPGQYQYTESESLESPLYYENGVYFTGQERVRSQVWLASDGSGRNLSVSGDPRFPTVRDRAGWVKAGRPPLDVGRSDDKFAPGTGVPAWERILTKLPTDPRKLAGLISGRKLEGGPPGPQEDFAQIGDLLRYVYTPPKLRAALFEVAAHTPGVEVLGRVKDQAGRVGIGVAQVSGPGGGERTLSELIFDPATAGLLGEQTVAVNSRTHARTLTDWTVYLRAGVAGSMYSVPAHLTVP